LDGLAPGPPFVFLAGEVRGQAQQPSTCRFSQEGPAVFHEGRSEGLWPSTTRTPALAQTPERPPGVGPRRGFGPRRSCVWPRAATGGHRVMARTGTDGEVYRQRRDLGGDRTALQRAVEQPGRALAAAAGRPDRPRAVPHGPTPLPAGGLLGANWGGLALWVEGFSSGRICAQFQISTRGMPASWKGALASPRGKERTSLNGRGVAAAAQSFSRPPTSSPARWRRGDNAVVASRVYFFVLL